MLKSLDYHSIFFGIVYLETLGELFFLLSNEAKRLEKKKQEAVNVLPSSRVPKITG